MPDLRGKYIVETAWLAEHLHAPDLVILDGSWHLPTEHRDPKAEFLAEHIPGAVFFDIDDLSDETSDLPHMLPSTVKFASRMKRMGVGDGARIVVYDASAAGLFSAARVWWTLRAMGHEDVAVLNGGLKKWRAEGRELTAEATLARSHRHFTPRANAGLVRDLEDMRALVAAGTNQIVDARGAGRFEGREAEPRPGLRSGHMPGARNVPYSTLLQADGAFKDAEDMRRVFVAAGVDLRRPVVTTCGSGVTAAIVSLAMAIVGQPDTGLYDGSWAEWGKSSLGTDVSTGP